MTILQTRLINAYAILILAGKKKIEDVPEILRTEVEIKVAEIEVEKLS